MARKPKPVAYLKRIDDLSTLRAQDEKAIRKMYRSCQTPLAAVSAEGAWILYTFLKPKDKLPKILHVYPVWIKPLCTQYAPTYRIEEVSDEE